MERLVEGCLRKAGIEVDDEFRTVTGLLSLLDKGAVAVEAGSAFSECRLMVRKSSLLFCAMAWGAPWRWSRVSQALDEKSVYG